jgi:hypothetical protein
VKAGEALACVSVDLDSLHHYCRIHGLPESILSQELRALVYTRALPRFLELFKSLNAPATLFVVGEDAEAPWAKAPLLTAVGQGIELGNHSYNHLYHLTRMGQDEVEAEVQRGSDAIERVTARRPLGFRAPGYAVSKGLYAALERQGYLYDSSAYPATPYYLAKATMMGLLRAVGRPSRAMLDSPKVLFAPQRPYHPNPEAPYEAGAGKVLELPISVTPWARVPFIGTFVALSPRWAVKGAYSSLWGTPLFNFELHGVDLLDEEDGVPGALCAAQRDLKVPWEAKRARFLEVLGWLGRDFELTTLERAAERMG